MGRHVVGPESLATLYAALLLRGRHSLQSIVLATPRRLTRERHCI